MRLQPTPNEAARVHLPQAILENPAVYSPAAVMDRLDAIRDVGQALTLYDRIWTEIKISH